MNNVLKLLLAGICLLLATAPTEAQTNLSVQGTVQEFDGSAVENGLYDITFKLYTTETGGTAVWSETQSVRVTGGVYSVLLGEVTPLTAAFNTTYYLGITLPGGPELFPRSRLTSSPYALSLIGQDNIFPSTGAVGAGTASPTAGNELHVKDAAADAKVLVEGATGSEIEFKKGANTASITYDGTNINIENLNLVFDAGLNLPAGQTVNYNGIADWRLVDTDDFSTGTDGWQFYTNWNNSTSAGSSVNTIGSTKFLAPTTAQYNSSAFKKFIDLTNIPHSKVKVVFTYHFLDAWETSDYGWAGFSDTPTGSPFICWSDNKGIHFPEFNGASYFGNSTFVDSNTRGEMVMTHSGNFYIYFGSGLNYEVANDENFGIGDIEIWVK